MNQTPEYQKRVKELYLYIRETDFKLRRIHKYSKKKIDLFWQDVWSYLLAHPDMEVEFIVESKLAKKNLPN